MFPAATSTSSARYPSIAAMNTPADLPVLIEYLPCLRRRVHLATEKDMPARTCPATLSYL